MKYKIESIAVFDEMDSSVAPYAWMETNEAVHDQRNAYMQYLKDNLHGVLHQDGSTTTPHAIRQPRYHIKDTSHMKTLLNCTPEALNHGLKGTADLMIVGETAHRMNDVFTDLQLVVEVKKGQCKAYEQQQLTLELVAANLKCEKRCAPIKLLTNLNDYWCFMWFTPDSKKARLTLSCPANGFKAIKDFLAGAVDANVSLYEQIQFLPPSLPKRQNLHKSNRAGIDAS
ncbi:hypothetical protein DVH05_005951 [Phytophthora capsici]|nr:hypothetical protein DVH05_005951 [Phytophthora capsici]